MTRDTTGPAGGLKVHAVWYRGNPKASSSGDYLVPQKKTMKNLRIQEEKNKCFFMSVVKIYTMHLHSRFSKTKTTGFSSN